ncbi:putative DNA modification/repair radical SAM protein [Alkalibaculum sp. M08DMB]|uniref:Putative DNA modification/repair radical SAM protein n=1 Tax=Alkalibaculum sporogenes TaxID=2655001 RepID=A0A6A7KBL9_9FIRM|nr:putative DNA modification/repair radical SAM protein [Alkalibaculum sporogenes]MPW26745.1 putative DNA modification/repair radical SAM protein [Alkalibaculum sporogenes]
MDEIIFKKLEILSDAAKYDVSCSSSGVERRNNSHKTLGNSRSFGICHSWSSDGRCISLLKILLTNNCIYDCAYCVNKVTNDVHRATFTPEEVAKLTIEFYRRNYIEGLFLSSAIEKSPNQTMEDIYRVLLLLRNKYHFNGYIHIKAIPGADKELINNCGYLTDRMSINIELPTKESLQKLAPQKKHVNIITPMKEINNQLLLTADEKRSLKTYKRFVPAGQSTQMIIGATDDTDYNILNCSEYLYKKFNMKRVYYSAYVPVNENSVLSSTQTTPPLLREHRLYQADWLLRFYNFKTKDIFVGGSEFISTKFDPKMNWALNNLQHFPVEINYASLEKLIQIPGIGHTSARRIIKERKVAYLNFEALCKTGCVIKRAKYFVTCKGKYYGDNLDKDFIIKKYLNEQKHQQLSFFG